MPKSSTPSAQERLDAIDESVRSALELSDDDPLGSMPVPDLKRHINSLERRFKAINPSVVKANELEDQKRDATFRIGIWRGEELAYTAVVSHFPDLSNRLSLGSRKERNLALDELAALVEPDRLDLLITVLDKHRPDVLQPSTEAFVLLHPSVRPQDMNRKVLLDGCRLGFQIGTLKITEFVTHTSSLHHRFFNQKAAAFAREQMGTFIRESQGRDQRRSKQLQALGADYAHAEYRLSTISERPQVRTSLDQAKHALSVREAALEEIADQPRFRAARELFGSVDHLLRISEHVADLAIALPETMAGRSGTRPPRTRPEPRGVLKTSEVVEAVLRAQSTGVDDPRDSFGLSSLNPEAYREQFGSRASVVQDFLFPTRIEASVSSTFDDLPL